MDFLKFQNNLYKQWKNTKLCNTKHNPNKPFCLTLPPPNITGKLHLGHAWDSTIQDIIIRAKKLQKYDTFFLCGTDHAGIATQVKAENEFLKLHPNINREDIKISELKKFAHKWAKETKENIHQQWINLGLLVDWENEVFTLDDHFAKVVSDAFLKMYDDNLIVREGKMIHLDCKLKTAISNIEVIYEEVESSLYYVKYFLEEDTKQHIIIATSRPETIFCDCALIIHPNDARYNSFHNKHVINPLTNKTMPILLSDKIEIDFGTGAMKLTPGHDFNDFEINKSFNLDISLCIHPDGKLNNLAGKFEGLDRIDAREKIIHELKNTGHYVKTVKYNTRIAKSQRTNTIVEPLYSVQWFIKANKLAQKVLVKQKTSQKTEFFPPRFNKVLNTWLENTEDWCISRQLWWGHPIPIMHNIKTKEMKPLDAKLLDGKTWIAETDVLDTWFSSSLWPFVSLKWPNKNSHWEHYFPTNLLVTGYDIIFFWVAKMMMMSIYFTNKIPFKDVYIHGLIRDANNRKMSKSLNNGIDPNDVIKQYGADSLRHFLISNSEAGLDLRFDETKLMSQSHALVNKINDIYHELVKINSNNIFKWQSKLSFEDIDKKYKLDDMDKYLLKELLIFKKSFAKNINDYTFININIYIRNFFYSVYIKHYLNSLSKMDIKHPNYSQKIQLAFLVFIEFLIYLHPVMPFITDDIYSKITGKLILQEQNWDDNILPTYITDDILIWYPGFIKLINLIDTNLSTLFDKRIFLETNLDSNNIIHLLKYNYNLIINTDFNSEHDFILRFNVPEDKKLVNVNKENIQYLFDIALINSKQHLSKENIKAQIDKINSEIIRCKKMLDSEKFLLKAPKLLVEQEKTKLKIHQENLAKFKLLLNNNGK